ncbi:hypothetical protein OG946_08810 [Streptomyces sp. NBC_01808]|uniref:hypothetical protein n=1 Tax=Streptomyces sp. NBC_01808 TaxID=2975947 RepID=UPI002DDA1CAE|nr:hypothetical protein [Streptomyces sp. NBC_01808]WSA37472.1 hypothetical protein OG946_08810 [Streptomyces sp. NBC_01808]
MQGERFTAPTPPGTRLLHIGPHKTGTTALQAAFHQARDTLREHGVVYAGPGRQAKDPAVAIARKDPTAAEREPWEAFCREAAEAGDLRFFASSEFFATASADAARRAVKELAGGGGAGGVNGASGVHVVVTLRPLRKIMPSHWQQYVKHGLCESYETWLDAMLRKPPYEEPTPDFWHLQRHDELIERWAEAAGPENVTAVVVDEARPLWQFRVFEQLLDLPDEVLQPQESGGNSSLTQSEAELLLQLNRKLRERNWSTWRQGKVIREGVVPHLQSYEPAPDEPRITTPEWAETAVAEVAARVTAGIAASGVRVVGDLEALSRRPSTPVEPVTPTEIPTEAATEAVLGGILASAALAAKASPPDPAPAPEVPAARGALEDRPVRNVPVKDLVRVVARRAVRRMRG